MIWLTGCRGMLAQEIARQLSQHNMAFIGTGREIDLSDETSAASFAASCEGLSWIINCAAYTAVDKAEGDQGAAHALNALAPRYLAQAAKRHGAKLVHISTDYVFDGRAKRPYTERDAVCPLNVYGSTKAAGEQAVLDSGADAYVFRTSWLYGFDKANFVYTMVKLMNSRDSVSVVSDQIGSPTFALSLARCIVLTVLQDRGGRPLPAGLYHCSDRGEASWFDFACEIYRIGRAKGHIRRECEVRPCTSAEYPLPAKRPSYSVLAGAKIRRALGIALPEWKESLSAFMAAPFFKPC